MGNKFNIMGRIISGPFFITKGYIMYKLLFIVVFFLSGCVKNDVPEVKKINIIDINKNIQTDHTIYMNHAAGDMFVSNLVYAANIESAPDKKSMAFKK